MEGEEKILLNKRNKKPIEYGDDILGADNLDSSRRQSPNQYDSVYRLNSLSLKVKNCDAYISLCEDNPSLVRFVRWLRAELQLHGVICAVENRSSYNDAWAHQLGKDAIDSATLGIIMVTPKTFSSPYAMEELNIFLERGSLVAIFFGLCQEECLMRDIIERRGSLWQDAGGFLWQSYGGLEREWKETVNKLSTWEFKLFMQKTNWRECILEAVSLVGKRFGKVEISEKVRNWKESVAGAEHLFPRNENFVGREEELLQLELKLFGYTEGNEYLETKSRRSFTLTPNLKSMDRSGILEHQSDDFIRMESKHTGSDPKEETASRFDISEMGIACVSGESGIGKTELAVEFSHRFAQRYKMVLWVGGEARYLCHNYLNLLPCLGIDSSLMLKESESTQLGNLEEQCVSRVRRELMRDIPYLLIIDNLESEREWWHQWQISDFLPLLGRQSTHVIITTRMPQVMNIQPIRLYYLSAAEALTLMKRSMECLPVEEVFALKSLEEKVGRVPLGLSIISAILSEISISPTRLLDVIKHMPHRNITWLGHQNPILSHNRGMVQLMDACFALFDLFGEHGRLASRIAQACGWFAPSPVPVHLLVTVASHIPPKLDSKNHNWKRWLCAGQCRKLSHDRQIESRAIDVLVRLRVARSCTRSDSIIFHDIIKLYSRKTGNFVDAHAMVNAIIHHDFFRNHAEHIWAASFLLFNFGSDPGAIYLKLPLLLDFIRKCVLPLAWHTYSVLLRYGAALELLQQAMKALEAAKVGRFMEDGNMAKVGGLSRRIFRKRTSVKEEDSGLHEELAYMEATLLETLFKLMHKSPTAKR